MVHHETPARLNWLALGILWGAYLVVMYRTGALQRCYQTSPYFYFTGAAGVLLVLLSAKAALAILRRPASACTCEACHGAHEAPAVVHWSWWADAKAHLVLGLVLMPLMVGVLVPSRGLNALAALRRGGASDPQDILDTFRAERRLHGLIDIAHWAAEWPWLPVLRSSPSIATSTTVRSRFQMVALLSHSRWSAPAISTG
mgnify:CR=1 FL=1